MYVWQVVTERTVGKKDEQTSEWVVGDHIDQVIKHTEIDRRDLGMRVIAIIRRDPVIRILSGMGAAANEPDKEEN